MISLIETILLDEVVVINKQSRDVGQRIKVLRSFQVSPFDLDVLVVFDPDFLGPQHLYATLDAKTNESVSIVEEKLAKRRAHTLRPTYLVKETIHHLRDLDEGCLLFFDRKLTLRLAAGVLDVYADK